jgi:hypothetical protein
MWRDKPAATKATAGKREFPSGGFFQFMEVA